MRFCRLLFRAGDVSAFPNASQDVSPESRSSTPIQLLGRDGLRLLDEYEGSASFVSFPFILPKTQVVLGILVGTRQQTGDSLLILVYSGS